MLTPGLPITTERLVLRAFEEADYEAVRAMESDAENTRYLLFGPRDDEAVRKSLRDKMAATALADEGDRLDLAIADGPDVTGAITLFLRSLEHGTCEIGWVMRPGRTGRGHATEAARAVLRLAFQDFAMHRVIARLDARNTASARLAERLGMRREGHFLRNEFYKGEWADEYLYALLEEEFTEG